MSVKSRLSLLNMNLSQYSNLRIYSSSLLNIYINCSDALLLHRFRAKEKRTCLPVTVLVNRIGEEWISCPH